MSAAFTHLDPAGASDLLAALRYPVTDPTRPPAPAPAAAAAEAAVAAALVDLSGTDSSPGSAAGAGAALAAKGLRIVWPGDLRAAAGAVARERPQVGALHAPAAAVGRCGGRALLRGVQQAMSAGRQHPGLDVDGRRQLV